MALELADARSDAPVWDPNDKDGYYKKIEDTTGWEIIIVNDDFVLNKAEAEAIGITVTIGWAHDGFLVTFYQRNGEGQTPQLPYDPRDRVYFRPHMKYRLEEMVVSAVSWNAHKYSDSYGLHFDWLDRAEGLVS